MTTAETALPAMTAVLGVLWGVDKIAATGEEDGVGDGVSWLVECVGAGTKLISAEVAELVGSGVALGAVVVLGVPLASVLPPVVLGGCCDELDARGFINGVHSLGISARVSPICLQPSLYCFIKAMSDST